jgi:hypothetical protein
VKVITIIGGTKMIGTLNVLDVAKTLGPSRTLQMPFEMHALLDTVAADLLT